MMEEEDGVAVKVANEAAVVDCNTDDGGITKDVTVIGCHKKMVNETNNEERTPILLLVRCLVIISLDEYDLMILLRDCNRIVCSLISTES